jgi:dTDP-4-dehydrorhamnose 3,5-epimerase
MKFIETPLPGAYVVDVEPLRDERGSFARIWCRNEFAARGLDTAIEQCSVSFSPARGTLRGMHYQTAPHAETKVVRCTRGAIYDVIVDLRDDSPAFCKWFGVELTAESARMLYIPKGCAHGFVTLKEDTEVYYQMSVAYVADAARGVRWDDPAFNIAWPVPVQVISERDRRYPVFSAERPR